jgi:hypothetical protein
VVTHAPRSALTSQTGVGGFTGPGAGVEPPPFLHERLMSISIIEAKCKNVKRLLRCIIIVILGKYY